MTTRVAILLYVAVALSGCGRNEPEPEPTVTPANTPPTPAKLEADDPRAGMNTNRPDSQKDVKPEPGTSQPPP